MFEGHLFFRPSPAWELWALFIFFHTTGYSLHSANAGGNFPFWWSHCWHEGFSFLSSGVSVYTPWKCYHWIWSMDVIPKRFWLLAFKVILRKTPSAPCEILTLLEKQGSLCKAEVHFAGMVWTFQGFCRVSPCLAVRNLLTTMVWTLVLPKFLITQGKPLWVSRWSLIRVWNELLDKCDCWGKNFSFTLQEDLKNQNVAGCFERPSSELTRELNCYFIFSSITYILSSSIRLLICLTCI